MKLTAEFDSVNSADHAASAIRKNISVFSDISINPKYNDKSFITYKKTGIFSSFNPSVNQHIYSFPVTTNGVYSVSADFINETDLRTDTTLEVICGSNDRKAISGIITNCGGREISFKE